jgi:hypothetical protein
VMKWITGRPVTPYRIYEVGEDEVRWWVGENSEGVVHNLF